MPEGLSKEWARLNPIFVEQNDSLFQLITHAAKETLYGFFAPFLILAWIFKSMWKSRSPG